MQDLNEGDSVVMYTDNFETNGRVGKIQKTMPAINRAIVVTESGTIHHIALNALEKRDFLTE